MRHTTALLCTLALLMSASASAQKLLVTSKSFKPNGAIPRKFTCEGRGISPPLKVENIPAGTKTLAITLHDPDAPLDGGFTHWVIWNINGEKKKIKRNFKRGEMGPNTLGQHSYKGMCPPLGIHHYHFKVYALDTKLDIDKNSYKEMLEKKMQGHILAEGELVGVYKKKKLEPTGGAAPPPE